MQGYFWQKFRAFALLWNPLIGANEARSMSCSIGPGLGLVRH